VGPEIGDDPFVTKGEFLPTNPSQFQSIIVNTVTPRFADDNCLRVATDLKYSNLSPSPS
jgi:hypothetical protein